MDPPSLEMLKIQLDKGLNFKAGFNIKLALPWAEGWTTWGPFQPQIFQEVTKPSARLAPPRREGLLCALTPSSGEEKPHHLKSIHTLKLTDFNLEV